MKRSLRVAAVVAGLSGLAAVVVAALPRAAVQVGENDIGGVVTGPKGPEAGVWVIAETTELPTKFVRIVVTDDQGRYLIPDLPKANYNVWVRGYGLVDSPKSKSVGGKTLEPHRRDRAQSRAPPPRTIPPATGSRCSRCPTRASSRALGRAATASRRTSNRRPTSSARSSPARAWPATSSAARARARFPPRSRPISRRATPPGSAECNRVRPARRCCRQSMGSAIRERSRCSPTGPIASRPAKCRRRRAGRRGSSATSSSPSGIGPIRRRICTTSCPPTAAIRRSTRTG